LSSHIEHHRACLCSRAGARVAMELSPPPASTPGDQRFFLPQTEAVYERSLPFRITHLALDWNIDDKSASLKGSAELHLERVSPVAKAVQLDACDFQIDGVTVDGEPQSYIYDGRVLEVPVRPAKKAAVVRVQYRAKPQRGMYFLSPDEAQPERPTQIWTQFQDQDARYVFPCMDDPSMKMTTSVRALVPKGMQAVSNGDLVREEQVQGRTRYTWESKLPHASYLVALVCGSFDVFEQTHEGVPLAYWVPKGRLADGKATFAQVPKMLTFLNRFTGTPYPWSRYTQVVVSDFQGGGMENTTLTILYEHTLLDSTARIDTSSDELLVHELAHHWFGNLVTCRDWSEGWLNEGFATYCEHLFREETLGEDAFLHGLRQDLSAYLNEAQGHYTRPVTCKQYQSPMDLFDRHLYEKGSLFLHGLRCRLGAELFQQGVARYLQEHQHKTVETRDLQRALEAASGTSLDRAFTEGLAIAGHVELTCSVAWADGVLSVTLTQTQSGHQVYEVYTELVLHGATARVRRESVRMTARTQTLYVTAARPAYVAVDPKFQVLGPLKLTAPTDMLVAMLKNGENTRVRTLAAESLADGSVLATEALGAAVLDSKMFWGSRVTAVETLAKQGSPTARKLLLQALSQKKLHPKVARAVATGLTGFRTPEVREALLLATAADSYHVRGAALLALGKQKDEAHLGTLANALTAKSWAHVVASSAAIALGELGHRRGIALLRTACAPSYPSRVRRAAFSALATLLPTKSTRDHLSPHLLDADTSVRMAAASALAELADFGVRGVLAARIPSEHDPRARRNLRELALELANQKPHGATKELRQELDTLKGELTAMRQELERLAAKTGAKLAKRGSGKSKRKSK
jgi:aminopeptidase N